MFIAVLRRHDGAGERDDAVDPAEFAAQRLFRGRTRGRALLDDQQAVALVARIEVAHEPGLGGDHQRADDEPIEIANWATTRAVRSRLDPPPPVTVAAFSTCSGRKADRWSAG